MDSRREARDEVVQNLVREIVARVRPIRVILFGSTARGEARPDSDIDLLIVMPEGTHRRHTAQRLYLEIQNIPLAFDLLVVTPGDLERHRDNPGLIYRRILAEGRELYAA